MSKLSLWVLISLSAFHNLQGQVGRVPDELESAGGHSLGLGNDATAAVTDQGAVKNNPAMMAFEKFYQVSAGYHWPSYGREFYQAGIVDSKTSSISAGILFNQSVKKYQSFHQLSQDSEAEKQKESYYDSQVQRRIVVGIAQAFSKLSVGINGQHVDYLDRTNTNNGKETGTTLGLGIAGLITPQLRFGLSGENITRKDELKNVAPRTLRFGIAYTLYGGTITIHSDLKERERVSSEVPLELVLAHNNSFLTPQDEAQFIADHLPKEPEKIWSASVTTQVQNIVRLMAAYGKALNGDQRSSLSFGVAIVNNSFSMSYSMSKPYLETNRYHQAANVSINMSI